MNTPATSSPDRISTFFDELEARFEQVASSHPVTEYTYSLAGQKVLLKVSGPKLGPTLLSALEHLQEPIQEPDLTVGLWDTASTGIAPPPSPWKEGDYIERGEVKGFNTDRFRTTYHIDANILCMYDGKNRRGYYWIRDAGEMPQYEEAAPLRPLLHWHLGTPTSQLVHGAAVGFAGGGVLIAGKSGVGKSSTALTCLLDGLGYIGDDYCAVTSSPEPTVYSLYNTAKVNKDNVERFPELEPKVHSLSKHGPDKAMIFVHEHFPGQMLRSFPLKAIILPRVTENKESTLRRISAAEGLTGLAPSTVFQLPGAGHTTFMALANLIKKVPCYELELGSERDNISLVIQTFLENQA